MYEIELIDYQTYQAENEPRWSELARDSPALYTWLNNVKAVTRAQRYRIWGELLASRFRVFRVPHNAAALLLISGMVVAKGGEWPSRIVCHITGQQFNDQYSAITHLKSDQAEWWNDVAKDMIDWRVPPDRRRLWMHVVMARISEQLDGRPPSQWFNHPISLDRDLLMNRLVARSNDYYHAPKWDGERLLLHVWHRNAYVIGRSGGDVVLVGTHELWSRWHDSLLDVEMLCGSSGNGIIEYKLLDVQRLVGEDLRHHSFSIRLGELKYFFDTIRSQLSDVYGKQVQLSVQDYQPLTYTSLGDRISATATATDGIIFVSGKCPYTVGYDDTALLKWKPSSRNTIDVRVVDPPYTVTDDEREPFQIVTPLPSSVRRGDIVEVCWRHGDADDGGWHYLTRRTDKDKPNAPWVIDRIVKSIEDGIEADTILESLERVASSSSLLVAGGGHFGAGSSLASPIPSLRKRGSRPNVSATTEFNVKAGHRRSRSRTVHQ